MLETIQEALLDSLKLFPLLFLVYFLIEYIEFRFSQRYKKILTHSNYAPAVGALLGSLPQCGFSVIVTSLYNQKSVSLGTLLSVYLSTSDEALPLLLSSPLFIIILPLILIKISLAIIFGSLIDLFIKFKKNDKNITPKITVGCCGHHVEDQKINIINLFLHPLKHSIKIVFYLFIFTLGLGIIINTIKLPIFDNPFYTGAIGLIPNCAASVFITKLFIANQISFGALLSGLLSSAGLGVLLLFKNPKKAFYILFLLYSISVFSGFILQNILG